MKNAGFLKDTDPLWIEGFKWLEGLDAGGLNLAHEMVDRHVREGKSDQVILTWIDEAKGIRRLTYGDLADQSSRFANLLVRMGIKPGDVVATLLGRLPQTIISALGTWKRRAVFCPLFTEFGPEPIRYRLCQAGAVALVTTTALYNRKIAGIKESLPQLRHIFLVDGQNDAEGLLSLPGAIEKERPDFAIGPTDPESTAIVLFTSGTTGMPKGVVHVHASALTHVVTSREVLGLSADETFWCTADPAWVTGTVYGMIAPLMMGSPFILHNGPFDGLEWLRILSDQRVTVFYTSPTALRQLMTLPEEAFQSRDFSGLKRIYSVGEPLPASTITWAKDRFGVPVRDTWWQSETGGIMISVTDASQIHYGSMGRAVCGIEASVMHKTASGKMELVKEPNGSGELVIRSGWPGMFRGYLGRPDAYQRRFVGEWYLTGDRVQKDLAGYFRFLGRTDDTINTAGHLVGPFEVEQALMSHPQVLESAVVGEPDPVIGERVHAYVQLMPGAQASPELKRQLMAYARERLGAAVAPRDITFLTTIPHNPSGKILRNILRNGSGLDRSLIKKTDKGDHE